MKYTTAGEGKKKTERGRGEGKRERERERETEREGEVDGLMVRIVALSNKTRVAMGSQRFLQYKCGERDRERPQVREDGEKSIAT